MIEYIKLFLLSIGSILLVTGGIAYFEPAKTLSMLDVFFAMMPTAFQKAEYAKLGLSSGSKLVLVLESLFLLASSTLFVMAIRRKFRR